MKTYNLTKRVQKKKLRAWHKNLLEFEKVHGFGGHKKIK